MKLEDALKLKGQAYGATATLAQMLEVMTQEEIECTFDDILEVLMQEGRIIPSFHTVRPFDLSTFQPRGSGEELL